MMGNVNYIETKDAIVTERTIDSENKLVLGIVAQKNINPLSAQCIKFGNNPVNRLNTFIESENCLTYLFENNTVLTLTKNVIDNDIYIDVDYTDIHTTMHKQMSNDIRKRFTHIGWGSLSTEFDKIPSFVANL